MPKRKRETTSPSSEGESENTEGYGSTKASGQAPLANGNESRLAVSGQTSPVASTSTHLRGVIVKDDHEENEVHEIIVKEELDLVESEVEDADFTASPQLRIDRCYSCSATSTGQQSQVLAVDPHEKYSEGSLVMGCMDFPHYPYWPGMIRKARNDEDPNFPVATSNHRGNVEFFVQFFSNPTKAHWRLARHLRVFDAAKPNRCNLVNLNEIAEFEKGIRIAKAATHFPAKVRLAKCTLPRGAKIDDLLREIENNQDVREVPRASPIGLGTGGLLRQNDSSVAEDEDGPALGNRRSIPDVIAGLTKQAELLVQKDLEKEKVIKALTKDNSKLTSANRDLKLQLQSNNELIVELRANLSKSDKDKLECKEALEKVRSKLEGLEGIFKGQPEHK